MRPARTASFGGKLKSILASFLAALHHSRRIQARRVLRQYRHLIDQSDQRIAFDPQSSLEDR
jgi:hypothetical protein